MVCHDPMGRFALLIAEPRRSFFSAGHAMSSNSRKVVERGDEQADDFESQQRLRAELARSSTTLRRAPQPSEDTIDAIQASLEAAFAQLDNLEQPRRMPPPLPKLPPPLPRNLPPPPPPAPPEPVQAAPPTVDAPPEPPRSRWRRWLGH